MTRRARNLGLNSRELCARAAFALAGVALARNSEAAALATPGVGEPDDLLFTGLFADIAPGGVAHVSRKALAALPGVVHLSQKPADSIPAADLTVLPLPDLLQAIPLAPGADGLVLIGNDRWESFLPLDVLNRSRPYLMLYYAGRSPAQGWPSFSPIEKLEPYYTNVSPTLGPPLPALEHGEIDVTQIVQIRAVNAHDRYAPFYAGALATLTGPAAAGRKLFLHECNFCHQGPDGVGGNVSLRPFTLLELHATLNTDYFRAFVRNPTKFIPTTIMPVHDYFAPHDFDDLVAFLTAAKAAGAQ